MPETARELEGTPDSGALASPSLFANRVPAPPASLAAARRQRAKRLVAGLVVVAVVGTVVYFSMEPRGSGENSLILAGAAVAFMLITLVAMFASGSSAQTLREFRALHEAATAAGMEYTLEGASCADSALWKLSIFDSRRDMVEHVFQRGEHELLFDYSDIKTVEGEVVGAVRTTVAAFRVPEEVEFSVMPRAGPPASDQGRQGDGSAFAEAFAFSGKAPTQLSDAARDELVSRGNWTIEGASHWVVVCEKGQRVPAAERPDFSRSARRLVELVTS